MALAFINGSEKQLQMNANVTVYHKCIIIQLFAKMFFKSTFYEVTAFLLAWIVMEDM